MTDRRVAHLFRIHPLWSSAAALAMAAALLLAPRPAAADEGGVSFWLPGQFSSFAAVPGDPGWSLPVVYYHAPPMQRPAARFRWAVA